MNKHTTGPWEFLGDPDDDECRIRQAASVKNGRGYSSEITICENVRTQANASLIAAAPDLLETLESVLAELEKYQNSPHPEGCDGARDYLVKIMHAKHFIAKAKGEKQ